MSRSSRRKEKSGNNGELSKDYCYDGTSARTRPFSFEDIMLRRKNKKEAGEIQAGLGEGDNKEQIVEMAADALESHRDRHHSSILDGMRHVSDDSLRVSSRRKEDDTPTISGFKLVKGKAKQSRDNAETQSKLATLKDLSHDDAKSERHAYYRKKSDHLNKDSKGESGERHPRDLSRKNMSMEKGIMRSVRDRERTECTDVDDRQVSKRRNIDQARFDYENESKKRQTRGLLGTDKYGDRRRGKSEKESRKKHQVEDKEKTGNRESVQKLDLQTSKNSELSVRKEKESSQVRYEESRPKWKRPRSKEREDDRGRRSPSHSPRAHKLTSLGEKEHGCLSSHSSKDRSLRSHTDFERKRVSSNGSNSNYRRYSGSSSGLGGYSPRKRKTLAAAKTPSPINRSPERRSAGWDLPPAGKDGESTGPVISDLQLSSQIVSLNAIESSVFFSETAVASKPVSSPNYTLSSQIHTLDSIQLTQATRPMRRLYVENLPASASEKALMECINSFLLSSDVKYIQGTLPCISCMIHKEKGEALLEFLTPEDASAALSFDGRSFSGSIIKVRRPKDFVEVTTDVTDKSVDATNSISDAVADSSHKIFIGGISKVISSEMLMEIARAFGPLKAFHYEHNGDIDAPCAFLEYVDHLVTAKACAGLNGMKLGGQVLTVVQAISDTPLLHNASCAPFYGIPEHAKPLLERPTEILKLKNVLDPQGISSLSEAELEEILEDIRLECTRFGLVKTVNVAKHSTYSSISKSSAEMDGSGSTMDKKVNPENVTEESTAHQLENYDQLKPPNCTTGAVEDNGHSDDKPEVSDPLSSSTEPYDMEKTTVSNGDSDDKPVANITKDENCESTADDRDMSAKDVCKEHSSYLSVEYPNLPNASKDPLVSNDEIADASLVGACDMENKVNVEGAVLEDNARSICASELNSSEEKVLDNPEKGENEEEVANFGDIFEAGCVLVEFKRAESSCMAAHCLHGRLFSDREVTVEYVSHNLYRSRFPN